MQAIEPKHFDLVGLHDPTLRFRPERLTPAALDVCSAIIRCSAINDGEPCKLVNVSSSGAAFELGEHEVVRNGQVLDGFVVTLDEVRLYDGRATVINQRCAHGVLICGVAFLDAYLPLATLDTTRKAAVAIREASRRLADAEAMATAKLDDWLKALAADFRLFLETLRRTFEAVAPPDAPEEVVDDVVRYVENETRGKFHDFICRCNDIVTRVTTEQMLVVRHYLKAQLHDLLLPSPLFRQSYYKPMGYAGDFVVMSMLYGDHYQGEGAYARFLNRQLSDTTISRAVIGRLHYLTDWIARLATAPTSTALRILSVASGPARELRDFLASYTPSRSIEISLLDQDARALASAQSSLAPLLPRLIDKVAVHYLNAGVKQLIKEPRQFSQLAGQTLIYSAGLFDYLPATAAKALLTNLYSLLAPDGWLVIGNLSHSCDTRGFLEGLVDWNMIYRTDEQLLDLAATTDAKSIRIECEATGVNRFLVVQR